MDKIIVPYGPIGSNEIDLVIQDIKEKPYLHGKIVKRDNSFYYVSIAKKEDHLLKLEEISKNFIENVHVDSLDKVQLLKNRLSNLNVILKRKEDKWLSLNFVVRFIYNILWGTGKQVGEQKRYLNAVSHTLNQKEEALRPKTGLNDSINKPVAIGVSFYTHTGGTKKFDVYRTPISGESVTVTLGTRQFFMSLIDGAAVLGVSLEEARELNRSGQLASLIQRQNDAGIEKTAAILNQELASLLALHRPAAVDREGVDAFENAIFRLAKNNEFLNGLFKLQYLPISHYNKMNSFIGEGKIEDAKRAAQAKKAEYARARPEQREQIIKDIMDGHLQPTRMGYNKAIVDVLNRLKYPLHQIVQANGVFLKTPENVKDMDVAILEQVDVAFSECPAVGVGKALQDKMYHALSRYLNQNGNQLPKALQIPFSNPDHTMLMVVENRDGKCHLSVLDSLAPAENSAYNKSNAIAGAVAALRGKFPGIAVEIHYLKTTQGNNNCCGMHVQMNMAAVSQAIKQKRNIFEILGDENREKNYFSARTALEMETQLLKDQALAADMSEAVLLKAKISNPELAALDQYLGAVRNDSRKRITHLKIHHSDDLRREVITALTS